MTLASITVLKYVGQASACSGLQPARPRDTRPGVFFCRSSEPGSHRVLEDIALDSLEFVGIPHETIIALVLPERPTRLPQQFVASRAEVPFSLRSRAGTST